MNSDVFGKWPRFSHNVIRVGTYTRGFLRMVIILTSK